ncbi:MAG: PfkB family carbohydrate kinase, partial [Eubacteriales bacterium]|nr:PfkB family carbohydrate kinase [Eubacteriales bacterium]
MKIACMGDNCIDVYRRLDRRYPTGNVVDTAVNLVKLGTPASVISTTGNDANGIWLRNTLAKEGIDISHLKIGSGPTAITYMDMDGTERIHGEYVEGVLENIVFDEEDIAFASDHDLVHT